MMKLFLIAILLFFSMKIEKSFGILLPSPEIVIDSQFESEISASLEKKREIFIKYSSDYYEKYVEDFKNLNQVTVSPFESTLKDEILGYLKRVPVDDFQKMTISELKIFLHSQLNDQLNVPKSEASAPRMVEVAEVLLKKNSDAIEKIKKQMEVSDKSSVGLNLTTSKQEDYLYWGAIGGLVILIIALLLKRQNKK